MHFILEYVILSAIQQVAYLVRFGGAGAVLPFLFVVRRI